MKRERITPFQEEICKKFTLWIIEKDLYLKVLEWIKCELNPENDEPFYINTFTDKKFYLTKEEIELFNLLPLVYFIDFNDYYHKNKVKLMGLTNRKDIRNLEY